MTAGSAPVPRGRRKRVLLLTSHPIDARDGADKELSIAIATRIPNVEFTWFGRLSMRGREPLSAGRRVPLLSTSGMPGPLERAQAAAWALVLERRVDLLHAVLTIGPGFGRFTRLRERLKGLRHRPAVHTVPAVADPAALTRAVPLGTTVALSRSTQQVLREAGFPDVRLIPPGVDLERWSARPRPCEAVPVVAFAGHYDPGGGLEESIAALATVAAAGRKVSTLFLMRPRPGQDEALEAERLRQRAQSAGLTEVRVQGRTPDMPTAIAGVDVLLLPARHLHGKADVPLTVLQAMATRRPVVVSDLQQMVALGSAATRVPAGDVPALADAIGGLLERPGHWEAMAAAGLDLVQREFSAASMATRYAELYAELLEGTPAGDSMKPPRDAVAVEGRGTADGPAPEPRSRPDRDAPSHAGLVIAATVFLVAAELRLWRIQQSYELFIDEVTYTEIARNVALGQGVLLYGEPFFLHPPAMFSSLALAMTLTGPDEDIAVLAFALRPLPAVIGALTPGLVALLLHRLTRSVGLATAGGLLLAVEPFLIRFDSRVLLEAQAMAASAAGFVMLMVIIDRERCGRPVSWRAILAGLLLLASLLTKETYAFVSIIPVLGLLATGLALRRSTSATVVATIVAGYAAYVLALVFAGQGAEWFAQKTRGVRRLLGLSQITGFNQEGSVGLVERIVANLSYFTVTYALIGLGLLALGWLLLELRRGVPAPSRPGIILLVAWALGATVHLAYAVTLGTLEEQMFYLMVVTTAPALFVAAHMLLRPGEYGRCHRATRTGRTRASALRLVLLVTLALAFVVDTAVWWRVHTIPDVAYTRFLAWARVELPPGSTLAVTDETTQFVLRQVRVGRWETGEQLRKNDADYVLLVGELVRQGYSDVDEEFLQIASRGPVVFEAKGRSLGVVTVHDVRAVIAD